MNKMVLFALLAFGIVGLGFVQSARADFPSLCELLPICEEPLSTTAVESVGALKPSLTSNCQLQNTTREVCTISCLSWKNRSVEAQPGKFKTIPTCLNEVVSCVNKTKQELICEQQIRPKVKKMYEMPPTKQFVVESSGIDRYLNVKTVRINDSLWNATVSFNEALIKNISACKSAPSLNSQKVDCLNGIAEIKNEFGEKLYADGIDSAVLLNSDFSVYPVKKEGKTLTNLDVTESTQNFLLDMEGSWQDGKTWQFGFGTVNITTVTSDELIISGASSATADFSPEVNLSSSILFISIRENEPRPDDGAVHCVFFNASRIECGAFTAPSNPVYVKWYVAEFESGSGVKVQRGLQRLESAEDVIDANFSSVNASASFLVMAGHRPEASGSTWGSDDFFTSIMTNSTNLQLQRAAAVGAVVDVSWQVVEFESAKVQNGTVNFGSGDVSVTLDFREVNVSSSFFTHSIRSDTGTSTNIGQKMVQGTWFNASRIIFERDNTGVALVVNWQVVELPAGNSVQWGSANFTSESALELTIGSVNVSESVAFASGGGIVHGSGGKTDYSGDDLPGVSTFTVNITSGSGLRLERSSTAGSANVTWFVIDFFGATDVTSPFINFVPPTDADAATISVRNWTLINVTFVNTTGIDNVILDWNGTNVTIDSPDLVLSLKMNGNPNDDSRYGFTATKDAEVNCAASGRFGQGCDMNNNKVSYPDSPFWTVDFGSDNKAWSGWVNFISMPGGSQWASAFETPGGTYAVQWEDASGGNINFILWDNAADNIAVVPVGTNEWHYFAVTIAGQRAFFYWDGEFIQERTITSGTVNPSGLYVGADNNPCDCILDELRIWTRNLSAEEISESWMADRGKYYSNMTNNTHGTYSYSVYANMTDGTENTTETRTITFGGVAADTTVPLFTAVANNASGNVSGLVVNWTTTITDETELSFCWFTHNDSGTFVNSTVQTCSTPFVFDEPITITATVGNVCGFFSANDTANNHNQSENSCFTIVAGDCTCPISGTWLINDGSSCELSTVCTASQLICEAPSTLTITNSGALPNAAGSYVASGCLSIEDGGFIKG